MERVRIGIIGCGRIADLEVLGYLEHPQAEIVAVCDKDAALAARRRAEWGAQRSYTDADALLRDTDIDAVDILLPHHLHRAVAIAALAAGKDVSLQKPPTLTLGELDDVARAARASGRTIRVFENFAYYPPRPASTTGITASTWVASSCASAWSACTRGSTSGTWETARSTTVPP